MKIDSIDSQNNLFKIENVYSPELIEKIKTLDHLSSSWKKEDWQEEYNRRKIIYAADSIYSKLNQQNKSNLDKISKSIKVQLAGCDTAFWLDLPGFSMQRHLDNPGVYVSMQVYLSESLSQLGTVFYHNNGFIRYAAPYKVNTGYIMINGPDQIHGMETEIVSPEYRLSSYTWFYPLV